MNVGDRLVYVKTYNYGNRLKPGEHLATLLKTYDSGRSLIQIDGRYCSSEVRSDNIRPATEEDITRLSHLNEGVPK
jgi:hypothetical protein